MEKMGWKIHVKRNRESCDLEKCTYKIFMHTDADMGEKEFMRNNKIRFS